MQWQDRLGVRMLPVPYAHITFTVPHELNGLIRKNPAVMFNLLFQSAWQTIKKVCADEKNVGGLPGMTAVLHIPTYRYGTGLGFRPEVPRPPALSGDLRGLRSAKWQVAVAEA